MYVCVFTLDSITAHKVLPTDKYVLPLSTEIKTDS